MGTAGDLVMAIVSVQSLNSILATIGNNYEAMVENSRFMEKLRALLDQVKARERQRGVAMLEGSITTVEVAGLGFSYPGNNRQVLHGIDLKLRRGETVAVVGLNGAGKTTLAKLLLGLYAAKEGQVLVNGRNILDYQPGVLRRRMSCIFQDFGRFFLTLRENVAVGDIERVADDEAIWGALSTAGAAEVAGRLPDGLDAQLGRRFGGPELSGGEWQKVALARALLRDGDFLILDEPSAALDAQAEYDLYLKFKEMVKGKICLLISHRFTTVRMADRIVVLDGGRIVEEGTHIELLDKGGLYATMYHQQADRYREPEANRS